jgi:hypothetical protein
MPRAQTQAQFQNLKRPVLAPELHEHVTNVRRPANGGLCEYQSGLSDIPNAKIAYDR